MDFLIFAGLLFGIFALAVIQNIAELKYGNQKVVESLADRLDILDKKLAGIENIEAIKKDLNELKIKIGFSV